MIGAPLKFLNEVALPYQGDDCLIWPFKLSTTGYASVYKDGVEGSACKRLCEMVHGPQPSPSHETAHSCGKGNVGCINPKHLSWKTHAENMADKPWHRTDNRGEKHYHHVLTETGVRAIRIAFSNGVKRTALARMHSVTYGAIDAVVKRKSWAWLE